MHGRVKLLWVPGHVGTRGNDIADELARKDAEKSPARPKPIAGVTQQHVKPWIKGNVFQEHYRGWRELAVGLVQS